MDTVTPQFEALISSLNEAHAQASFISPGRYRGFDTAALDSGSEPGHVKVLITHAKTGILPADDESPNGLASSKIGALVTPHGAVIQNQGGVPILVPHNNSANPAYYYLKCTFHWVNTPGGESPIYTLDTSNIIEPATQLIIGKVRMDANGNSIDDITYFPKSTPPFAGANDNQLVNLSTLTSPSYNSTTKTITLPSTGNKFVVPVASSTLVTLDSDIEVANVVVPEFDEAQMFILTIISIGTSSGYIKLLPLNSGGRFITGVGNNPIRVKSPATVILVKDHASDYWIALAKDEYIFSLIDNNFGHDWQTPSLATGIEMDTTMISNYPQAAFSCRYNPLSKSLSFRGGVDVSALTLTENQVIFTLPGTVPIPSTVKYIPIQGYGSGSPQGSSYLNAVMYIDTQGVARIVFPNVSSSSSFKRINFDGINIPID